VRIFFIFDFSSVRYSKFNQALLFPSIEMVKVAENASKARVNLTEFQKSEYSRSPHFLLLGYPVSQSLSPLMHNTASEHYGMDARYFPIALESSEFTLLASHFNNPLFKGANVTIPYKLMLRDYVDDMDESARAAGAVNTIVKRSAKVLGYNTDSYGFAVPLVEFQDEHWWNFRMNWRIVLQWFLEPEEQAGPLFGHYAECMFQLSHSSRVILQK